MQARHGVISSVQLYIHHSPPFCSHGTEILAQIYSYAEGWQNVWRWNFFLCLCFALLYTAIPTTPLHPQMILDIYVNV